MAITHKLLRKSLGPANFSTLTSTPITLAHKLTNTNPNPNPNPNPTVDLTDTERLFSKIATGKLVRSLAIMQALAVEPVVDAGMKLMRSETVMGNRWAREVVMWGVEKTVYGHFCAGSGKEEVGRTVAELSGLGLKGILDYGSEDAEEGSGCDRNLDGFLKMVEMTSDVPRSSVSFACVKVTAICPISLLERISDLLRWAKKDPSFSLPWRNHSIPLLADSSPLYQTLSKPEPLTPSEELELQEALKRLQILCKKCAQVNLPVLLDAEYTSVQPAIDYFTYTGALEFNKEDRPLVFGTIQAYLRDSKERMVQIVEAAEREKFLVGLKLVRGAYLTRETHLADSLGGPSPIHQSIQETHRCYDDCASFMLEKVVRGCGSLVLATHNLESGKVAAAKAEELGIGKGNQKLQFSQLMGMADGLSLGLRNAGFQVSKYLPYGPVDQVFPYLLRRAEENRGMLSASTLDRVLIKKELRRRMSSAVLGKGY